MLPRILMATALVLATTPAGAAEPTDMTRASIEEANGSAVEILLGSELQRDYGMNGRPGLEIRMGRPGIRLHEAPEEPAATAIRVHSATREPGFAAIPTHGVTDAFRPSRIPVQRLHGGLGGGVRTHGLRDEFRASGIRVHGVANP